MVWREYKQRGDVRKIDMQNTYAEARQKWKVEMVKQKGGDMAE
jgi:hypothetical protein